MRCIIPAIVALILSACHSREIPDNDTLTVALGSAPKTLDPRFATDANGQRILNLVFNSFVGVGPDLKIIGDAAEKWTYKNLVYTFTLKPHLSFSTGAPVTFDDIKYSIEQFQSEKCPMRSAFLAIEKVEGKTDNGRITVKLKLKEFSASLLIDLSILKILPKQLVEAEKEKFSFMPIGSNAFKFRKIETNEIALEARSDFGIEAPKTKFVQFKIIQDDNTRYLKVLKGAIDLAQTEIPPTKVKELEEKDFLKVLRYPGLSMNYIIINMQDPLLKDLRARRALSQALNVDEMIQFKLEGLGTRATSIMPPASPFYDRKLVPIPYNLKEAQAIFKDLGLTGKEISLKTSNNPTAVENGKVIAHQLEQAGLKIKHQSFEWGTFSNDLTQGNFQLATMRWVGTLDPDIYYIAFHSKEIPPGRNRGHYSNPTLDRLLEQGRRIDDEKKRIHHYQKVQEIVMSDLPIIPLWYDTQVAVIHSRVKDYEVPLTSDFSPLMKAHKGL